MAGVFHSSIMDTNGAMDAGSTIVLRCRAPRQYAAATTDNSHPLCTLPHSVPLTLQTAPLTVHSHSHTVHIIQYFRCRCLHQLSLAIADLLPAGST